VKSKKKILRIVTSLNPKYGGPSVGIIESSKHLIKNGFKVDIVTLDKQKGLNPKFKNIKIINFSDYLGSNYRFSFKAYMWLFKSRIHYDFFIIHGLWQFQTLLARLLLKGRYLVFTHGQLDPFFGLNFLKKIKKKIYWYLFEYQNLQKANSIILTSEQEKKNLNNTFVNTNKIKKQVIRYGIFKKKINKKLIIKKFHSKFPFIKKRNFYLFLGRFHEKKGCEIIIKSIEKLGKKINTPILLAGPFRNNNYEKKLKNLVKKYNLQKKIFFSDGLYGDLKWGAIYSSKAMLLASQGENFGVSLAESLSMGRPVLTTKKVNIHKDISKYSAGLISSNTVNSFSRQLYNFENFESKKIHTMSLNAKKCFNKNFNLSLNDKSLIQLFK
jgi:glycosyltransferase involved in cell wall biosynthesis